MLRRKAVLSILLALSLAGAGCGRLPRLTTEEALAVAAEKAEIKREGLEAAGEMRVDKKAKEAVQEFRLRGFQRPLVFAVRFTHHKYRGWEFDSLRDRHGDWVKPELFAEDHKAFLLSDTEYLLATATLAVSAFASEHGRLPKNDEIMGEKMRALYLRYRSLYEKDFWFTPPSGLPYQDAWGRPLAYGMDMPDYSVLPSLFEIRSQGPDGEFGNQDDIFARRDAAQVMGVYAWLLWFLR